MQQNWKENSFQIIKSVLIHAILEYVINYFGQATNYVGQIEIINYLPGEKS